MGTGGEKVRIVFIELEGELAKALSAVHVAPGVRSSMTSKICLALIWEKWAPNFSVMPSGVR